jgi:hypothetical protein
VPPHGACGCCRWRWPPRLIILVFLPSKVKHPSNKDDGTNNRWLEVVQVRRQQEK